MKPIILILLIFLAALLLLLVLPTLILSFFIYRGVLVRKTKEMWGRTISEPGEKELVDMYHIGAEWAQANENCRTALTVRNESFTLAADYFDFGNRRAVIIIPGRTETSVYSRFYAEPYKEAGFNVLLIDNRSHGLSEGNVNALGYREYRDIHAWARLLHDGHGIDKIVLHGICIGSSTALFALTDEACPDYLCAMTADGMYKNFYESFKNHMIEQKHPTFPLLYGVMVHIRVRLGADVVTDGPYKRILKLRKPILFLHSREDIYSVPKYAERLYDACPSEKQIVWFEHGAHSRLRITSKEKYDAAVKAFYETNASI